MQRFRITDGYETEYRESVFEHGASHIDVLLQVIFHFDSGEVQQLFDMAAAAFVGEVVKKMMKYVTDETTDWASMERDGTSSDSAQDDPNEGKPPGW